MYRIVIRVDPSSPTSKLKSLTVGQYSYAEVKITGVPSTASAVYLSLFPMGATSPVVFLVDLVTKTACISSTMFPAVGTSKYEISFMKSGHVFWCGSGAYTVESTSLATPPGNIVDDMIAERLTETDIAISANAFSTDILTDTTLYTVLGMYVVSPAGSEVGYSVTNIQVSAEGYKVFYNATVKEAGYILRYTLIRKG